MIKMMEEIALTSEEVQDESERGHTDIRQESGRLELLPAIGSMGKTP